MVLWYNIDMIKISLFDESDRFHELSKLGDPLERLNRVIDRTSSKHITAKHTASTLVIGLMVTAWFGCGCHKKADSAADGAASAQPDSIVAGARTWDCGDNGDSGGNVVAALKDGGMFVVSGTGAMADYHYEGQSEQVAPWQSFKDSVTAIIIEDGVTSVGNYTFRGFTGLTSVTIPNSVKKIGDGAFSRCSGLTSIMIPNTVTFIGPSAFAGTGLTSIVIPDSVRSINGGTFGGCERLTSVTISPRVVYIGDAAFTGCTSLTTITIPNSVRNIEMFAFGGCANLKSIIHTNPSPPPSVGVDAFGNGNDEMIEKYYNEACLYVPAGSAADYRIAGGWRLFKCIKESADSGQTPEMEDCGSTGIPEPGTPGNTFTDYRDGKKYRTVTIGKKRWMASNLNYKTGVSWCYYNEYCACAEYGRLYDWNTAMKACPKGWRLPTRKDWQDLCKIASDSMARDERRDGNINWYGAGKRLKSKNGGGEDGHGIRNNGTDDYGFTALLGGYNESGWVFHGIDSYGDWWTSTEGAFAKQTDVSDDAGGAYCIGMNEKDDADDGLCVKGSGYSVRCVRDVR